MDIYKFNQIILKNYIKPDVDKKNHFLYNTENSMKMYENIKKDIFLFEEEIFTQQTKKKITKYIIKSSDIIISNSNNNNYKECLMLGKQFEEIVSITIDVIKITQNKLKDEISNYKETVLLSFVIDIKIPIYIGNEGMLYNSSNYLPNPLEIGGFFVTKNVIKKFVVFKEDRMYTWPRYDILKTNVYHVSFNSIPLVFIDKYNKPQYLVINIDLNLNKLSLNISSNKTLPEFNVLLLICFLTKLDINSIKKLLISRFYNIENNEYYDDKIVDIIEILFNSSLKDLKNYQLQDEEYNEKKLIEVYIKKNFLIHYKKKYNVIDTELQLEEYRNIFYKNLLPSVNSLSNLLKSTNKYPYSNSIILYIKGMTLFSVLEDMLVATYQHQVYPDKYHLSNRRIESPGNTFKDVSIELVKNLINDFKEQIDKQLKNKTTLDGNFTIKPYRKIQNIFNNIFNMQDKKYSLVIKPLKNINFAQKIIINNLVVWDSKINLTKYINIRDPNLTTFHYLGPVDTPDHGKKVAINRRLNIGTKINDKNFESHKKLVLEIYEYIQYYIEKNSKIENQIIPDLVNIYLVDDSEIWIGNIEQEQIIDLYENLLEKKRQHIFESNLIDIALIPYYVNTKLKILLPIKKYRKLRINIGNKIPFMPAYLVKNGELVIETLKIKESIEEFKNMLFSEIIQKYEFMEYIGPEQLTYTNICENINIFKNLSLEERKLFNYVSFDNNLNLSILESMIFDIGKMPGVRGIFSTSQLKNSVSSIQPDSLNTIESSKFVISGYQEPCITNDVLIESRIAKQSFGTHVLVAYLAYNDNIDDSIIINKDSVNNGLFVIINTLLYKGEVEFKHLQNTNQNIKKIRNSYKKLDDDSIPKLDIILEYGDALYGNVEAKLKKTNNVFYLQDNSIPYKFLIPGRVNRILVSSNDTYKNIRYTVAVYHYAERGHKIGNQCAQKSTISKLADPQELLYNENGIRPDIILNSLSKINRKTTNMFFQTIITNYYNYIPLGNNKKKQFINYNSFSNNNILTLEKYKNNFKKHYPKYSDEDIDKIFNSEEIMFDPYTGESLKYKILMGPIYFSRLTQISDEKLSARNRGKLNKLNQPPGGKQKGGSHRIGEMEVDLLATHGCANMLYEISNDSLEVQEFVLICKNCTAVATKIKNNNQINYTCINCKNINLTPIFERHILTKSAKVLIGLLNFRGIKINIHYNKIPILYASQI